MPEIVVDDVGVDGSTVWSTITPSRGCRRFFSGERFFVEYDVDVTDVPAALRSVPVLSQVCPVAWAVGADVRVPTVDRRFLDSLRAVRSALRAMYPAFVQGGSVTADEVVEVGSAPERSTDAGMLFTGGVDSLATYIRHREEDPTLINVQGWVVGIDDEEQWEHAKARVGDYGDRFGVETRFVRSNMLSFLDVTALTVHFDHLHDGGWYSAVGGGLGLLGLCAPLTSALDLGRLYIAATHWEEFPTPDVVDHWDGAAMPWGSHPAIDDAVAWGTTRAVHDGFDLTRQERIGVIADYVDSVDPDLPVRSCANSRTAANCSGCEKCFRTALGLAVEGVDPNRHGFDLDRASFERALEAVRAGDWLDDDHHAAYWEDLRRRASATDELSIDGASEFVDGLADVDFDAVAGPPTRDRVVLAAVRHTPYPVFATLYRVYAALRRTVHADEGTERDRTVPDGEPESAGATAPNR